MATSTSKPPPEPEPQPDPQAPAVDWADVDVDHDAPEMVFTKSGWTIVTVGPDVFRLRRPFVGELKTLRQMLEAATDQINAKANENQASLVELDELVAEVGDSVPDAATKRRHERLSKKVRAESAELIDLADRVRLDWWQRVFELLCVDDPKVPADWPSWAVSINTPGLITQHWRNDPLGRGR